MTSKPILASNLKIGDYFTYKPNGPEHYVRDIKKNRIHEIDTKNQSSSISWETPIYRVERTVPKGCKVLKTHDDGDLTLQCKDAKYVVTTDGKTFKEVKK